MPLYEYECNECGRRTEKIQKFSDAPLTVCPHCGGRIERTLTAPAVQFKGGGWYKDLYSSAKPASANGGKDAGSGGDASKPSESSTPAASSDKSSSTSSSTASPAPAASSKS
jgi:putative FmdB family regulatory protein